jgi:hypothetical protein
MQFPTNLSAVDEVLGAIHNIDLKNGSTALLLSTRCLPSSDFGPENGFRKNTGTKHPAYHTRIPSSTVNPAFHLFSTRRPSLAGIVIRDKVNFFAPQSEPMP